MESQIQTIKVKLNKMLQGFYVAIVIIFCDIFFRMKGEDLYSVIIAVNIELQALLAIMISILADCSIKKKAGSNNQTKESSVVAWLENNKSKLHRIKETFKRNRLFCPKGSLLREIQVNTLDSSLLLEILRLVNDVDKYTLNAECRLQKRYQIM